MGQVDGLVVIAGLQASGLQSMDRDRGAWGSDGLSGPSVKLVDVLWH